jgi:hypothetical protein
MMADKRPESSRDPCLADGQNDLLSIDPGSERATSITATVSSFALDIRSYQF